MYILGILLITLTGISRIYLGVHRPVDVIGGIVLGIVWVYITNLAFTYAEKTGRKYILLLFFIPVIINLIIYPYATAYKVAGTLFAFYLGYVIEPKYIKFKTKAPFIIQVIKMCMGLGVLFVAKELLKIVFPVSIFSDLIRYFILGLWVTVLAPWIFMRLLKKRQVKA